MHFIGSKEHDAVKISVYSWNNKYIVKFEANQLEQVYKIDSFEVSTEIQLMELISEEFIQKVLNRFKEMGNDWYPIFN
jgi:hypothetical protein